MGLGERGSPVAVEVLAVGENRWNSIAEIEHGVAEFCACMVYGSICIVFACWDRQVAWCDVS